MTVSGDGLGEAFHLIQKGAEGGQHLPKSFFWAKPQPQELQSRPFDCRGLRGEIHNKAFASRAWTYERSSPEICGGLETQRASLGRRWPMRLISIALTSARWNARSIVRRSTWSTTWR